MRRDVESTNAGRPPLFATFVKKGAGVSTALVCDDKSEGITITGEHFCAVKAPNGLIAQGTVDFATGESASSKYTKLVDLLLAELPATSNDAEELLEDSGEEAAWSNFMTNQTASVAIWRAGKCINREDWKLDLRREQQVLELVGRTTNVDNLQMWTEQGPSLIVRCHHKPSLVIAAASGRSGALLIPRILEPAMLSAYWGFLRHSFLDAASELGRRIAVESKAASDDGPELITAAHWAARFGRDELAEEIAQRLSKSARSDSDAVVMRWVLQYELYGPEAGARRALMFTRALEKIREQAPLYTETLRLMLDTLNVGQLLCSSSGVEALQKDADWVLQLARCTYWGVSHTTYRGLEPGRPDPEAIGAAVPHFAKKKPTN